MRNGYSDSVESALWEAVKTLEESAALEARLARMAIDRGDQLSAASFKDIAQSRRDQATTLRNMLLSKDKAEGEIV
jgi:hypothetical protein